MDTARALQVMLAIAKPCEGLYLKPYLCPAGVPTIGYGATYYEDGTPVTLRDPDISRERAEALLLHTVRTKYLPAVLALCPELDTPEGVGAITDFCFNVGVGALRSSTLRRRINAREWYDVPAQLRRWTRGGGRVLQGLVKRRELEIQLGGF